MLHIVYITVFVKASHDKDCNKYRRRQSFLDSVRSSFWDATYSSTSLLKSSKGQDNARGTITPTSPYGTGHQHANGIFVCGVVGGHLQLRAAAQQVNKKDAKLIARQRGAALEETGVFSGMDPPPPPGWRREATSSKLATSDYY